VTAVTIVVGVIVVTTVAAVTVMIAVAVIATIEMTQAARTPSRSVSKTTSTAELVTRLA
jgi:hypothetical protein